MNTTKWTRALLSFAVVGLVACGGAETEEEIVEEAPEAPAAPAMPEATVVQGGTLGTNFPAYEGQTVRLNGLRVTAMVGTSAVFVELPTTPQPTQFLVHSTTPPAVGSTVDVVGTVTPITPQVVDGWLSSNAITENDRALVEFSTHYLEAQAVQPAGM